MKTKITMKEIKKCYKNIIEVSYCGASNLLKTFNANYYTAGVYGWNADIYVINTNTVIVTGYRPFGNISNYNIVKKYDEEAKKIIDKYKYKKYEELQEKLYTLIEKFENEIIGEN